MGLKPLLRHDVRENEGVNGEGDEIRVKLAHSSSRHVRITVVTKARRKKSECAL